jgi:Cu/Ag efflux protein CusF
MHKIALAAALAAALVSSAAMAAAATTANGAIKSIDTAACTVTLDNGTVYKFAPKCDFSKLKVGEKVAVTFTANGAENDATAIAAA